MIGFLIGFFGGGLMGIVVMILVMGSGKGD
jgi:hypothetical protein